MLRSIWATIRQGKIELLGTTELPEGAKVLVTLLPDESEDFWLQANQPWMSMFGTRLRMISIPSYSKPDVILVRDPFPDLSS